MTWPTVATICILVAGAVAAVTIGHDATLAAVLAGAAAGYSSGPGAPTKKDGG